MKTIVCYGDSNTWGYIPAKIERGMNARRHPYNVRWPGVLSGMLGPDYDVVEAGIDGRTTTMNDIVGKYRNAAKYLGACLTTAKPVDLLIIMLGGNDTKKRFMSSVASIGRGVEKLVHIARDGDYGPDGTAPKILIVSPVHIREEVLESFMGMDFDKNSLKKSHELGGVLFDVARKTDCYYMNAAVYAKASGIDGLHMDKRNHLKLADAIHTKILEIL